MIAISVFDQLFNDWGQVENKKNLLALFVVVKFFVVIAIVFFLFWTIRKNAAKQCPDTSKLLDELEDTQPVASNSDQETRKDEDWERDPDWWKK